MSIFDRISACLEIMHNMLKTAQKWYLVDKPLMQNMFVEL